MIKHVPNILTFLRVLAIPFFIYCSLTEHSYTLAALFIFVFASITDYYDGYLARKYQLVSNFGKLMDPLADKLLVLSALIVLNIAPIAYLHWIVTLVIASREIAVSYLRYYYQKKDIIIPADKLGKLKTILQLTGIIAALTFYNAFELSFLSFLHGMKPYFIVFIQIFFWAVVAVTILSGVNYFIVKRERLDR